MVQINVGWLRPIFVTHIIIFTSFFPSSSLPTMTTKSAFVESVDPNVILSGDIIGMQIDSLGLMCTPCATEPITEKEEHVSHLRISTSYKKATNADYRRCMFKIENDSGEVSLGQKCPSPVDQISSPMSASHLVTNTENKHHIRINRQNIPFSYWFGGCWQRLGG